MARDRGGGMSCVKEFGATRSARNTPVSCAWGLSRLSIPEDRHGYENERDDPENDIFCPIFLFLFCHKWSTAYMKPGFKSPCDFLTNPGFMVLIRPWRTAAACTL